MGSGHTRLKMVLTICNLCWWCFSCHHLVQIHNLQSWWSLPATCIGGAGGDVCVCVCVCVLQGVEVGNRVTKSLGWIFWCCHWRLYSTSFMSWVLQTPLPKLQCDQQSCCLLLVHPLFWLWSLWVQVQMCVCSCVHMCVYVVSRWCTVGFPVMTAIH